MPNFGTLPNFFSCHIKKKLKKENSTKFDFLFLGLIFVHLMYYNSSSKQYAIKTKRYSDSRKSIHSYEFRMKF